MTTREAILAALMTRVQAITIAHGYATDAGDQVFLGEAPQLGENDPPTAIALVVEDDDVNSQGFLTVTLPIAVQALAKADLDAPWLAIEAVLGDVKRAIEQDDRSLGGVLKGELERGSTRTVPRAPGSSTVGVSVTYRCRYVELWGAP